MSSSCGLKSIFSILSEAENSPPVEKVILDFRAKGA